MRIPIIIGASASAIALVACVPISQSPSFTLSQYDQLQNGMSMEQVKEVMGAAPSTVSESGEWQTMIFSNSDGSNAVVMFQGGALSSKSQTRLK
ncbi:hypothetical protein NG796_13270 [Laspinema sp. A4]|uniref:hypothetical protein n=1 Tax=Laspinema sp. D2d TaxID=2953686 RepID=UPI0021BA6D3E|nr:hypothetical protein [Laspinema sp. D2d]MCT7984267.1 hypothetical protein [Laspinema sp. D2d]